MSAALDLGFNLWIWLAFFQIQFQLYLIIETLNDREGQPAYIYSGYIVGISALYIYIQGPPTKATI